MALDTGQRRVVRRIKQIGREVGASPKEVKAALETGRVESGFRNLPGGDADSAGWRQERASLYPNPTDLDASIRRFYNETKAVKHKYGRAGDLAAAVQRPAAQYRGRYQQVSGEAQALLGGAGGGSSTPRSAPSGSAPATTTVTPGVDNSALRGQAIAQFLGRRNQDPLDFALNIRSLQDVPSVRAAQAPSGPSRRPASLSPAPGGAGSSPTGPLLELYWQGPNGINAKHGKRVPQGFVSGHDGHVHAAASPADILKLARLAKSMGLHVGENPAFGGVAPVHVKNSNHYASGNVRGRKVGKAIDVSGDKRKLAVFAHRVASMYGVK